MASGPRYSVAARQAAAKTGTALPNGSYPIRNKAELRAAIRRRHQGNAPYAQIRAHILKRAREMGAKVPQNLEGENIIVISFSTEALTAAAPPKGKYGRSASLKWPWLYDKLRSKGYDKEKAARISNSRLRFRKKGRLNVLHAKEAHNPKVLARVAKADKSGKHKTRKQLTR